MGLFINEDKNSAKNHGGIKGWKDVALQVT